MRKHFWNSGDRHETQVVNSDAVVADSTRGKAVSLGQSHGKLLTAT